ncbi:MAG: hypothetical protein NZ869_09825 [Thermoanaerobaculum sp.]|nr:hypothetical protein [Thermoanaerobaculum sp.]MDW7967136.1 hypothetical protein [Thermoanaerobaculum sp.]
MGGFLLLPLLSQTEQTLPPVPRGLRVAVRVFLGLLIAGMILYAVVEQLGSRRRH